MVQGITFDKQLLASEDFAHQVNYFYQGKMGVSKGCEVSADVSGSLVISDGYFSIYGRLLKNVGDTVVEVPSVPSGTLYSSLVFEVDLTKENTVDQFNQGQFNVVSNATKYPTLVQEDLDNGGMVYQLEFARFENTVNGIVNLQDKRTILSMQMYTPDEEFRSHLAENVTQPNGAHGFEVESGTWIPTLRTVTSVGHYSYSAREGVYVRQGNKVLVQFNLEISDVGSPADETLYISGLPYIPNPNGQSEAVSANLLDATGLGLESQYWLVSGRCMASGIVLYKMAPNSVAPAGMRPANVKVGSVFRGSIEYKI